MFKQLILVGSISCLYGFAYAQQWSLCPSQNGQYETVAGDCFISPKTPYVHQITSEPLEPSIITESQNNTQDSNTANSKADTIFKETFFYGIGVIELQQTDINRLKTHIRSNRKSLRGKKFHVSVQNDSTGSKELNAVLAKARANVVKKLLIELGIKESLISITTSTGRSVTDEVGFDQLTLQRHVTIEVKE